MNQYTLIGGIVVIGAVYYIYSTKEQNKKQKRMNPKHDVPMPRHKLGHGLNDEFSRSWIKVHHQYDPRKYNKKHI